MKATLVTEIAKNYQSMLDQSVRVNGWVRSVRDSKTFGFIELNDGSCFKNIQIVFENSLNNFDEIVKITTGSSIDVE
jgi:asparaginyl-tRNA synthetase